MWSLRHAKSVGENKDRWSPKIEQRSQFIPDEHIISVAFAAMAPHTPIEESLRALKHHVTEATWMEIESKDSGKACVFHAETNLKLGICSSR